MFHLAFPEQIPIHYKLYEKGCLSLITDLVVITLDWYDDKSQQDSAQYLFGFMPTIATRILFLSNNEGLIGLLTLFTSCMPFIAVKMAYLVELVWLVEVECFVVDYFSLLILGRRRC